MRHMHAPVQHADLGLSMVHNPAALAGNLGRQQNVAFAAQRTLAAAGFASCAATGLPAQLACAIQWVRLNKVSMVGHCLSNFMLSPGAQLVGRVVAAAAARQCALSTVWQPRGF